METIYIYKYISKYHTYYIHMSINRYICTHIHTYSGMLPLPIRMGNEGSYRMRTRLSRKEICLVVTAQTMYTWWAAMKQHKKKTDCPWGLSFPRYWSESIPQHKILWQGCNEGQTMWSHEMHWNALAKPIHQIENPMENPMKIPVLKLAPVNG